MTKSELLRKFGVKFFDALIQYLADELNKTEQEVIDGICNKLLSSGDSCKIDDYDWMDRF